MPYDNCVAISHQLTVFGHLRYVSIVNSFFNLKELVGVFNKEE